MRAKEFWIHRKSRVLSLFQRGKVWKEKKYFNDAMESSQEWLGFYTRKLNPREIFVLLLKIVKEAP